MKNERSALSHQPWSSGLKELKADGLIAGETMVMIRLARFGAKKKPFYRVVAIEKERARNGRSLEVLGHYNPLSHPAEVVLKHDRLEYWKSHGAQVSDTVKRLVEQHPAPPVAPTVA